MKLRRNVLALITGAVMLSGFSSAQAVEFNLASLCDIKVYISGASAQDNTLDAQVQALMKDTGNIPAGGATVPNGSIWEADDDDWRVIIGEVSSTAFGGYDFETDGSVNTDTPTLCVYKRSKGGSAWGVQPITQGDGSGGVTPAAGAPGRTKGLAIVYMSATTCDDTDNKCNFATGADKENVVPDIGLSDVEPIQFTDENTPGPGTDGDPDPAAISTAEVADMEIFQQAMFAFGVNVNPEFYAALQVCQGLVPDFASVDYDSLELMPSLTKGQVTSFFTGLQQDLEAIPCTDFDSRFGKPAVLNLYTVAETAAANDATVSVPPRSGGFAPGIETCVRTDGSGTKAQFRIKFFGKGCLASGAFDFVQENAGAGDIYVMSLVSGSSAMGRCLSGNTGEGYAVLGDGEAGPAPEFTTAQRWKIGFQATDKNKEFDAGATNAPPFVDPEEKGFYRFVKVDGQAPTLANTAFGGWFDVVNATLQRRASANPAGREYFQNAVAGGSHRWPR